MKKIIFMLSVIVLSFESKAFACLFGSKADRDDSKSSSTRVKPKSNETQKLLDDEGGESSKQTSSLVVSDNEPSNARAMVVFHPVTFAGQQFQVPEDLVVQEGTAGALVIPFGFAEFQAFATQQKAATTKEYTQINKVKGAQVKDQNDLETKATTVYEDIRRLGNERGKAEDAESAINLLQQLFAKFPISSPGVSYKLARDAQKKITRISIEIEGKVVLVLVPGKAKK